MPELLNAALEYAEMGFPVFPLAEGTIKPRRGSHGHLDATTDEATIREWWKENPRNNIGVATGEKAGLFVVDVDIYKGGFNTMLGLIDKHGELPITRRAKTPSGGCHLWFCYPAGRGCIPKSDGKVGAGIDIKAERAAITAPPTRTSRGHYTWMRQYGDAIVEPPEWLVELCIPKPIPVVYTSGRVTAVDAYTSKIIGDELEKVRNCPAIAGQRNSTLSASSYHIGKLVNAGLCDRYEVEAVLVSAAQTIGLTINEALYTIRKAFEKAPPKTAIVNFGRRKSI